eukprot:1461614-Heterocapsa_arctica.AAC.1
MSTAAQEGRFALHILEELGRPARVCIHSDSSAARAVTARREVGRIKYLEVRDLWLQDLRREDKLRVVKVLSKSNPADLLTKWFSGENHPRLTSALWHWPSKIGEQA